MHVPPNILAAGFVTPAFAIAGILLASIPVIIHLLNRRRFKTVQWAAMDFLLAAMKKNRRKMKFEQWLLLATRCMVLALLGLALARPFACEQATVAAGATRSGLHVIVLDNSNSMGYLANRPNAATHLDQAKLIAKKLIESLAAGSESVAVVTTANPAGAALQPTFDLTAAARTIDRIEQSSSGTDLAGALNAANDIARQNSRQPLRRLELITDGTRSAWEPKDRDQLAALGKESAELFRIRHFNLAQQDQWNAAVVELAPAASLIRVGFNSDVLATARSFGKTTNGVMQWTLDNQPLPASPSTDISTDAKPITQSQARFKDGGSHVVAASLASGDRLRLDDARYRVVDVASGLRVLVVEGERGVGALAGSGTFLDLALAPPAEAGSTGGAPLPLGRRSASYVVPELVSDIELGNKVLADYRAVILAGVGNISPGQAELLKRFVDDGGTLIVFMGEPVSGENYNQNLHARGLLPGPLAKRVSVAADQRGFLFDFKPTGALHPLLRIFGGLENTGLDTAQVFTYWQLTLPADSKAERVLDFAPREGQTDPAITLHRQGNGRVVFFATTANAEWTSFPAKPAYVALMHELLSGSVAAGDAWMNRTAGEVLETPPTLTFRAAPSLKDPNGQEVQLQTTTAADGRSAYRSAPLTKIGVYTLSTGAATIPIAVNPPADETDIRPIGDAAVRAALGGVEIEMEADQIPATAEARRGGNDFGWIVMVAVLSLVCLESLLAMRFGHYKK